MHAMLARGALLRVAVAAVLRRQHSCHCSAHVFHVCSLLSFGPTIFAVLRRSRRVHASCAGIISTVWRSCFATPKSVKMIHMQFIIKLVFKVSLSKSKKNGLSQQAVTAGLVLRAIPSDLRADKIKALLFYRCQIQKMQTFSPVATAFSPPTRSQLFMRCLTS